MLHFCIYIHNRIYAYMMPITTWCYVCEAVFFECARTLRNYIKYSIFSVGTDATPERKKLPLGCFILFDLFYGY